MIRMSPMGGRTSRTSTALAPTGALNAGRCSTPSPKGFACSNRPVHVLAVDPPFFSPHTHLLVGRVRGVEVLAQPLWRCIWPVWSIVCGSISLAVGSCRLRFCSGRSARVVHHNAGWLDNICVGPRAAAWCDPLCFFRLLRNPLGRQAAVSTRSKFASLWHLVLCLVICAFSWVRSVADTLLRSLGGFPNPCPR